MDSDTIRILLVGAGPVLFFALIVGPLRRIIDRAWPDSAFKRFLFKRRFP